MRHVGGYACWPGERVHQGAVLPRVLLLDVQQVIALQLLRTERQRQADGGQRQLVWRVLAQLLAVRVGRAEPQHAQPSPSPDLCQQRGQGGAVNALLVDAQAVVLVRRRLVGAFQQLLQLHRFPLCPGRRG